MATAKKKRPKREKQVAPVTVATEEMIRAELERVAAENDGYLRAADVVDAARSEKSPLHDRFTWDDSEAAEGYRRMQAAQLIRSVRVVVMPTSPSQPRPFKVREFESAPTDRTADGGYRDVQDIMSDPERRASMVKAVASELAAIRQRHAKLTELAEVWSAIDRTVKDPS